MKIKRARGYRLYTTDNKRYLDLSMDFGRAVLGHRPNGLSLTLKNIIDRGLYSRYNNIYTGRLEKELKKRFPEYLYITILEHEGKVRDYLKCDIADPLFDETSDIVSYWRPFLETPDSEHLVLLYPFPGMNTTTVLLSRKPVSVSSDSVSPILVSGILRSMYDYDLEYSAISEFDFSQFSSIDKTTLKGPYLIFHMERPDYDKLVSKGLENGVFMNPEQPLAVLNREMTKGEILNFLSLFA